MKYSPEFSLMLMSCRHDDPGDARARVRSLISGSGINWDRLYRMADINSLRPQMAKLLKGIEEGIVPESFRSRIEKAYNDNLYDQISYVAEFINVFNKLKAEGIMIVPFKGFWLAHHYYGNLGDREAGDIDVFTDFGNLGKIRAMMQELGYQVEKSMSDYSMNDLASKVGEYNFDRFEGDRCLYHFEFHWRISSPVYALGINREDLASQIVPGVLQEHRLSTFTPSADLLLTIMHHGGKDPFMELKYVLDISKILIKQDQIDWRWVMEMARQYRLEKLVFVAIRLSADLMGTTIPEALKEEVSSGKVGRLAGNRALFMSKSLDYWHPWITFNDWLFRIRTRTGSGIRLRLAMYIAGVAAKRFLLPKRWRINEVA